MHWNRKNFEKSKTLLDKPSPSLVMKFRFACYTFLKPSKTLTHTKLQSLWCEALFAVGFLTRI